MLDFAIWNAESLGIFKSNILKLIRPRPTSFINCYNHKGNRLMTRLPLGLNHLREHNINHNFQICINPLCSYGMDIESTCHFFLHCPLITLLSTLNKTDCKLRETNELSLIEPLLFGNSLFGLKKKSLILNAFIDYILSTKRFEEAVLYQILITTTKYSCRSNHLFIL